MVGVNIHRWQRVIAILGIGVLVATSGGAGAEPATAVVVGTSELEVRDCPASSCEVVGTVPLGAEVEVTGDSVAGYVPVQRGDVSGVVPEVFVATTPEDPPYLVAGEPGCNRVALIFNIGVGAEPATGILDTLADEDVPATMFVMGWWVDEDPPLLKRLVREGYLIGSHGYGANELPSLTDQQVLDDLRAATAAIEAATGQPLAPYFTPYAAAIDTRVRHLVADLGYLPVAWEVAAADYGPDVTKEAVYARVMDNIYDGAIVELHLDGPASAESTGQALPYIIDDLRTRGYQFVTIPDMVAPC